jgi:ATP-dependent DNA ligase
MWRERALPQPAIFIEPCVPRPAKQPPAGRGWIHEIKHDGFRIMARRAGRRVRLLTRKGTNFSSRFPQIVAAVTLLPARSCLIDGEAHACALGCEGIVSKRLGSHYRSGRADCWIKVKNPEAPAVRRETEEDWVK